jgi:hypothetical protein
MHVCEYAWPATSLTMYANACVDCGSSSKDANRGTCGGALHQSPLTLWSCPAARLLREAAATSSSSGYSQECFAYASTPFASWCQVGALQGTAPLWTGQQMTWTGCCSMCEMQPCAMVLLACCLMRGDSGKKGSAWVKASSERWLSGPGECTYIFPLVTWSCCCGCCCWRCCCWFCQGGVPPGCVTCHTSRAGSGWRAALHRVGQQQRVAAVVWGAGVWLALQRGGAAALPGGCVSGSGTTGGAGR